jgi:serine protease Do
MLHRSKSLGLLACIGVAVLLASCSDGTVADQSSEVAHQDKATVATQAPSGSGTSSLPDFTPLVKAYGDAVVNVEVVQLARPAARRAPPNSEDPFSDFFRRFGMPMPDDGQRGRGQPMRGNGSGFIVTPDGYILTNAHVVTGADEVTVRLTDRREFSAKVIGTDARTDVAVIKIDAGQLPSVRVGDSNKLEPGQWVLAIGSPFGLANTATAGIVSATSRAVGEGSFVPFIQTDVAVNPGNSGGPLFNLQGEVVGINSMIFSQTGGYMGLSFAIPIDVATNVRDQLIKTGRVVRGRIGVGVQDVNAQLAQSFGLDRPRGALVSYVDPEGPAKKAGIEPGDVILSVNDQEIEQSGSLSSQIATMKPGSTARLRVWRERKERTLEVGVAQLQEDNTAGDRDADPSGGERSGTLGLSVRPLTEDEKRSANTQGSVVVEDAASPAADAGIQRGDILIGVNGRRIDSPSRLRDEVKNAKGSVALLIQRGDAQIFVPVPVQQR